MDNKDVVQKFKSKFRKFIITKVVDTGELYVATFCSRSGRATFCSRSGRYVPELPFSMTYDGEFGRYDIMEADNWKKLKSGTVLYEDYDRVEARKSLLAKGYDV